MYAYDGASEFPTNSFNATNYWVDVDVRTDSRPPAEGSGVTATAGNGLGEP